MIIYGVDPFGLFEGVAAHLTIINLEIVCGSYEARLTSQEYFDDNGHLVFRTRLSESLPLDDRRYAAFAQLVCRDELGPTAGNLSQLAATYEDAVIFRQIARPEASIAE